MNTENAVSVTVSQIKELESLQPRASMNMEVVSDYAALMKSGEKFPPLMVYFDGTDMFLVDGYHRLLAAKSAGLKLIEVITINGTFREAQLFSVGANALHGLRRSNEDKRRAVLTLLNDEEWSKWSYSEIARKCKVSDELVKKVREESHLPKTDSEESRKVITKHGTVATMNTANIGKKTIAQDPPTPPTPTQATPATVAAIAHVPVENVTAVEQKSAFVPASDIKEGLVDQITPDTRTEPPKLILKTLPNPIGLEHIPSKDVEITPSSGMWKSLHNAIKTGKVVPDAKKGRDAWQVAAMRGAEIGFPAVEAGETA